jgi:hypothetical protein
MPLPWALPDVVAAGVLAPVAAGAVVAGAVAAGVVAAGGAVTVTVEPAAQPTVSAAIASANPASMLRLTPADELFNRASLRTEENISGNIWLNRLAARSFTKVFASAQ